MMKPIIELRDNKTDEKHSLSTFEKKINDFSGQSTTSDHLAMPRKMVTKKYSYMSNDEPVTEILSNERRVEKRTLN